MIKIFTNSKYWLFFFLLLIANNVFAQIPDSIRNWDNQIYLGNKVAGGSDRWKYSGEVQVRLEDNMQKLDNWFVEGVATFLLSEKIEIAPDLRVSIKPDEIEYRPGIGVYYKFFVKDFQFVNQLKWQLDFDTKKNIDNGLRYAIFINHKINEKFLSNFTAGFFYRWREGFHGLQFIRFGPNLAYVSDQKHTINFGYFLSIENNGEYWKWGGIPVIQLIININKDYKYVPAKYFNF